MRISDWSSDVCSSELADRCRSGGSAHSRALSSCCGPWCRVDDDNNRGTHRGPCLACAGSGRTSSCSWNIPNVAPATHRAAGSWLSVAEGHGQPVFGGASRIAHDIVVGLDRVGPVIFVEHVLTPEAGPPAPIARGVALEYGRGTVRE